VPLGLAVYPLNYRTRLPVQPFIPYTSTLLLRRSKVSTKGDELFPTIQVQGTGVNGTSAAIADG
jgi:hypothetical protein